MYVRPRTLSTSAAACRMKLTEVNYFFVLFPFQLVISSRDRECVTRNSCTVDAMEVTCDGICVTAYYRESSKCPCIEVILSCPDAYEIVAITDLECKGGWYSDEPLVISETHYQVTINATIVMKSLEGISIWCSADHRYRHSIEIKMRGPNAVEPFQCRGSSILHSNKSVNLSLDLHRRSISPSQLPVTTPHQTSSATDTHGLDYTSESLISPNSSSVHTSTPQNKPTEANGKPLAPGIIAAIVIIPIFIIFISIIIITIIILYRCKVKKRRIGEQMNQSKSKLEEQADK